ncbi:hypothetical protein [Candidatus Planktophila dulcis]|uniref:hypothetical protein n=1 Tax=Candidatus Planktophila dulcis TaxID=1884914 RepID=UPI003CE7F0B9
MSTKTTFKRVALVAVAALGLGVLSVAPSSAAVTGLTVTSAAGTATTAKSDSSTAATYGLQFFAQAASDTVSVTVSLKSVPAGALTTIVPQLMLIETSTSITSITTAGTYGDSATAAATPTFLTVAAAGANKYAGASYKVILDTASVGAASRTNIALTAGTYVVTVITTPYSSTGVASGYVVAGTPTYTDVNIVVSALATASKVGNSAYSTAVLSAGSTYGPGTAGVDDSVAALATASTTAKAILRVNVKNASDGFAQESITATITGAGVIGDGTTFGKSVVLAATSQAAQDLQIRADGTAGTGTITVSTPSVTFAPKSITFYAAAAKTITAAVYNPVLAVGANTQAIAATAVDANGNNWGGAAYIVASAAADALVGGSATTPVACSYSATYKTHFCPVTTLTTGTAKFKVIDAETVALATATSNEVTVTVSNGTPASVKLAFDKASYAPFEKALITVTPLDAAGKTMQGQTISNLFATGGISSTYAFGSSSDTTTAIALTTAKANDTNITAGSYTYTVYMPASGDVVISATGGSSLAAAGQVKVTATASVVNSSVDAATDAANEATDAANAATDAALAAADAADAATAAAQDASDAVAALSATVAKLVASLKAQITSLTNLVIKIQKKVKA